MRDLTDQIRRAVSTYGEAVPVDVFDSWLARVAHVLPAAAHRADDEARAANQAKRDDYFANREEEEPYADYKQRMEASAKAKPSVSYEDFMRTLRDDRAGYDRGLALGTMVNRSINAKGEAVLTAEQFAWLADCFDDGTER